MSARLLKSETDQLVLGIYESLGGSAERGRKLVIQWQEESALERQSGRGVDAMKRKPAGRRFRRKADWDAGIDA